MTLRQSLSRPPGSLQAQFSKEITKARKFEIFYPKLRALGEYECHAFLSMKFITT